MKSRTPPDPRPSPISLIRSCSNFPGVVISSSSVLAQKLDGSFLFSVENGYKFLDVQTLPSEEIRI
ncbi:hypothetical protein KY285_013755 [Solanum tuberosum]|nr:hypothetical protein KY285_013755 [Solanum tuberosum]